MRLEIEHVTTYAYDPEAAELALRLRLYPSRIAAQRVESWTVTVGDEVVAPTVVTGFGDAEGLWLRRRSVEAVTITAKGIVETLDSSGVVGRLGRARPGIFLRRTELTAKTDDIATFADAISETDPLGRLHALNTAVGEAIKYRPGATDHGVTAAEALALGAGVCQDQAHLFLASARHLGVPARYVMGYLHDAERPLAESHAWAEAHVEGLGWVGFDPTHDQSPTDAYVRVCCGLDARDAAPIRGIYPVGPEEALEVSVSVAAVAGQSQQQQQGD